MVQAEDSSCVLMLVLVPMWLKGRKISGGRCTYLSVSMDSRCGCRWSVLVSGKSGDDSD